VLFLSRFPFCVRPGRRGDFCREILWNSPFIFFPPRNPSFFPNFYIYLCCFSFFVFDGCASSGPTSGCFLPYSFYNLSPFKALVQCEESPPRFLPYPLLWVPRNRPKPRSERPSCRPPVFFTWTIKRNNAFFFPPFFFIVLPVLSTGHKTIQPVAFPSLRCFFSVGKYRLTPPPNEFLVPLGSRPHNPVHIPFPISRGSLPMSEARLLF